MNDPLSALDVNIVVAGIGASPSRISDLALPDCDGWVTSTNGILSIGASTAPGVLPGPKPRRAKLWNAYQTRTNHTRAKGATLRLYEPPSRISATVFQRIEAISALLRELSVLISCIADSGIRYAFCMPPVDLAGDRKEACS